MEVRVFDFRTYVAEDTSVASGDNKQFNIQMFGIDEQRNTYSIEVSDFKPYFYVMVPENYTKIDKQMFVDHVKSVMGQYFADSLLQCALLRKKKLNGFDGCSDTISSVLNFGACRRFTRHETCGIQKTKKTSPRKC